MHPFDRLVRVVDDWAGTSGNRDVFAQVGVGGYQPKHAKWVELLEPDEFREKIVQASIIISHAGMGTILSVMQHGKPILVMPRLAKFGETRNDHQIASARVFRERGSISTVQDELELAEKLNDLGTVTPTTRISSDASDTLLTTIRSFIHGERPGVIVRSHRESRRNAA